MGVSYRDGYVSSDSACDTMGEFFHGVLEQVESLAIEQDLILRLDLRRHPARETDVLVETPNDQDNLRALLSDDERYKVLEDYALFHDPPAPYTAMEVLTGAAQLSEGSFCMLSARMRRVVREAYRAMVWELRNAPLRTWDHRKLLADRSLTAARVVEDEAACAEFVRILLACEDRHRLRPYGQLQAFVTLVVRARRWLEIASSVCQEAAQHVVIRETGWLKPENGGGMVDLDTGEEDPRGLPYIRHVGKGVETLRMSLPSWDGNTFDVHEIDATVDEDHLRFELKRDPLAKFRKDTSLRGLVMHDATRNHPWVYEAWMRHAHRCLEEFPSFKIPELELE